MTLKRMSRLQRRLPGYQRGCWEGDGSDQHQLSLVANSWLLELWLFLHLPQGGLSVGVGGLEEGVNGRVSFLWRAINKQCTII